MKKINILLIILPFFSSCICSTDNEGVFSISILGNDTIREQAVNSVHNINKADVDYIYLKTIFENYIEDTVIYSNDDISIFCNALSIKLDTAKTSEQYLVNKSFYIKIVKKDGTKVEFELRTSKRNGVFTNIFSHGRNGVPYGGYRIDYKILDVLQKYNMVDTN